MYPSQIQRITAGFINAVNDEVIGQAGAVAMGPQGNRYAGQLGKSIYLDPSQLSFNSTIGTLYGGGYRYVRLDPDLAAAPAIGQAVFWHTQSSTWMEEYVVSSLEQMLDAGNALFPAGIWIGSADPGNYGYIQTEGLVPVLFASALTGNPATGARVYVGGFGPGANLGLADIYDTVANPADWNDVTLFQARYLGIATALPVAGARSAVALQLKNVIG